MSIGDVYQICFKTSISGQACVNIFHYEHKSGSPTNPANAVMTEFNSDVKPTLLAVMTDFLDYTQLTSINLMDSSDASEFNPTGETGDIVDTAPSTGASFLSFGIRFPQAHPGAPNGYKRFPGVSEQYSGEELYTPPAGDITDVTSALASTLIDAVSGAVFGPVVVKRPFTFADPPTIWWDIASAVWTNLTTQSSRK